MKAVILAAGMGTRMGDLTKDVPKPLVELGGQPIIKYVLAELAKLESSIDEVVVVCSKSTKPLFVETLGRSFGDINLEYVIQTDDFKGTYGALFAAKELLGDQSFMVLNGDDIVDNDSLRKMLAISDEGEYMVMGFAEFKIPSAAYFTFDIADNGMVERMRRPQEEEVGGSGLLATGAYILNSKFWSLEPGFIKGKEYGIPQTLQSIVDQFRAVIFTKWLKINTPEDLEIARLRLEATGDI